MNKYGTELILDLHGCDVSLFNRDDLTRYLVKLCKLMHMKRADLHFWDYEGDAEAKEAAPANISGTSVIQFIETSNITIHTLDKLQTVFINIFSCSKFDHNIAYNFTREFFKAKSAHTTSIERLLPC